MSAQWTLPQSGSRRPLPTTHFAILLVLVQHAFVRTGKLVIEASRRGVCFELESGPAGSNLMPILSARFDVFIREVFFSTSV